MSDQKMGSNKRISSSSIELLTKVIVGGKKEFTSALASYNRLSVLGKLEREADRDGLRYCIIYYKFSYIAFDKNLF
jgi:hypothetical protein